MPYISPLLHARTSVLSLLSISSLLCSAYVLYFIPLTTSIAPFSSSVSKLQSSSDTADKEVIDRGPIETYLATLNAVLAGMLAITGWLGGSAKGVPFPALPGVVCGVVGMTRWVMGSVDVGELQGLRYRYKGA